MNYDSAFQQACNEALAMVSSIQDPAYRVAAFQVALMKLTGESPEPPLGVRMPVGPKAPETPDMTKSDTKVRILEMSVEGWLNEPRLPSEVRAELQHRGFHHNPADVRMSLLRLAQAKKLRRIHEGGKSYRYVKP